MSDYDETLRLAGVGGVMRAMAAVLIDRGHDEETIVQGLSARLPGSGGTEADAIESDLWDHYFGPAADEIAHRLDLNAYPED